MIVAVINVLNRLNNAICSGLKICVAKCIVITNRCLAASLIIKCYNKNQCKHNAIRSKRLNKQDGTFNLFKIIIVHAYLYIAFNIFFDKR